MNLSSDNITGASATILDAIVAANAGAASPYGQDEHTRAAERRLCEVFEREVRVSLVATGTGANALALATLAPPGTAIFCHEEAHVIEDECGAPEFFAGGAKLVGMPGSAGKVTPDVLHETLARFPRGVVRQVQPAALSLSQATEAGTLYRPDEVAALAETAHAAGVRVHMDGARFANAVATLGVTPADMSWRAGVDVLVLGATKNGALACEAVIVFDPAQAEDFAFRRKRGGHTLSKGRFLGTQMLAYLADDHWLGNARHANRAADRLMDGLARLPGVRCPWPREANEVFAILPRPLDEALKAGGVRYYPWITRSLSTGEAPRDDEVMVRMIASFATSDEEVDQVLDIARRACSA